MDSVPREDFRGSNSSPFGTFEGAVEKNAEGSKMFLISGTSHSSRNLRLHPMIFGTERIEGRRLKGVKLESRGLKEPCGDMDGTVIEIS